MLCFEEPTAEMQSVINSFGLFPIGEEIFRAILRASQLKSRI